jgi:hypothetical protein
MSARDTTENTYMTSMEGNDIEDYRLEATLVQDSDADGESEKSH